MPDANKDAAHKTLAERLKLARERKGWKQPHLATVAGVSTSTVGMIESGARVNKGSLPALAVALEVRHLWLLHGEMPVSDPVGDGHPASAAALAFPGLMGPDTERRLTRLLAVLLQIPESGRAAALTAATEVMLDHLPHSRNV